MSALPPIATQKADMPNVRFVPIATIRTATKRSHLFDHLIGASEQCRRHRETERLRRLEVDDQFVLGRRLHREVGSFSPLSRLRPSAQRHRGFGAYTWTASPYPACGEPERGRHRLQDSDTAKA